MDFEQNLSKVTSSPPFTDIVDHVLRLYEELPAVQTDRVVLAIAGPPAAGKSTLADIFCETLNQRLQSDVAAVFPMDGYHFDNAVIEPLGLLPRKGSPETFDADGFARTLARLKPVESPRNKPNEAERLPDVAVPVFDRQLDLARAGARVIRPEQQILIVEGNYLLLNAEPWASMTTFFDLTVKLDVPLQVLESRLIERWLRHDHTAEEAEARAHANDIPNAKLVLEKSADAQYLLCND